MKWLESFSLVMRSSITSLREKIEDDPSNPRRIVTVRGVGYRYERPPGTNPSNN